MFDVLQFFRSAAQLTPRDVLQCLKRPADTVTEVLADIGREGSRAIYEERIFFGTLSLLPPRKEAPHRPARAGKQQRRRNVSSEGRSKRKRTPQAELNDLHSDEENNNDVQESETRVFLPCPLLVRRGLACPNGPMELRCQPQSVER